MPTIKNILPPALPPVPSRWLPIGAAVNDLVIPATVQLAVVRAVGSVLHVAAMTGESERGRKDFKGLLLSCPLKSGAPYMPLILLLSLPSPLPAFFVTACIDSFF